MNAERRPVVVVLGGGFAGVAAARTLADEEVKVVLVDRVNHHTFQPLLYQVATAGLAPENIAVPIRSLFRDSPNVEVVLGNVSHIDTQKQQVALEDGTVDYDYLVVATGVRHSYFGKGEWEPLAPGLKTLDDAVELRRRILSAFETAERVGHRDGVAPLLTFVVVGGGATGVEMAGAIAELARHCLAPEYRRVEAARARVILLEAGDRLLPGFSPASSRRAQASLQALGVEVRLGAAVTSVERERVVAGGETLAAHAVVWAAGVEGSSILKSLAGAECDRAGRVKVASDLRVPGLANVFVVGDAASVQRPNGNPVPGVAPAAQQEGRAAARNIVRLLKGQPTLSFRYFDKGNMATVGRAAAVVEVARLRVSGFLAWLLWVFVHLIFLIGFRNRLLVFIEWVWAYATYSRGARLILGEPREVRRPGMRLKEA